MYQMLDDILFVVLLHQPLRERDVDYPVSKEGRQTYGFAIDLTPNGYLPIFYYTYRSNKN